MTNNDRQLSASAIADALDHDKRRERAEQQANLEHEQRVLDRLADRVAVP